jgi:rhodanese-related sulfurtransferase
MTVENIEITQVDEELTGGALLLDVREESEWELGHIEGATHLPLSDVPDRIHELPRDRRIVCICRSGGRSGRAAAFLDEVGFQVANVEGGMLAWQAADLPMVASHGVPRVD